MLNKTKITFVSPCYNEEDNVCPFYNLIKERMSTSSYDYHIVFINDGSKDNTYNNLKKLYESDPFHITVVNFLHNFGKESALLAGLKNAEGDYICVIDSDLQQDPKYAIEMAKLLDENCDIDMIAAKPSNQKDPAILTAFKKCFYKIINTLASVPFKQNVSDFRVFRSSIKDAILSLKEHNRFSKGIFSWVCPNVVCIDYVVNERNSGTTKWSFCKLFKYAINGISSFSNAPLIFPVFFGCIELFAAFILLVVLVCGYIFNGAFPYMFLWVIEALLLLTGMQSVNTGIVGQYVAKINTEVTNRPNYIIKEVFSEKEVH